MTDEDPMEWEDHGREEKIERARLRKLEWASTAMMKKVVVELLEGAVGKVESRHCEKIVLEMVDRAWEDGEVNRIMDIIGEAGKSVQERIEKSLSTNRREEEMLVETILQEEAKVKRLDQARIKTMTIKKKHEARKWKSILELLRRLDLKDYSMETEELEVMMEELMEVVERYDDDMEVTGQDEYKAGMSVGGDRVAGQGEGEYPGDVSTKNSLLEGNAAGVRSEIVLDFQNVEVREGLHICDLGFKNSAINLECKKNSGKRKGYYVESSRGVKQMKMD